MAPVKTLENIRVAVRLRPTLSSLGEESGGAAGAEVVDETTVKLPPAQSSSVAVVSSLSAPADRTFRFDHVYGPTSSQQDVYTSAVADLVDNCMDGFKGTVIAYGATGSGKTRTILGDSATLADAIDASSSSDGPFIISDALGLVPRAVAGIFLGLAERGIQGAMIELSYLEIYEENLTDLLWTPSAGETVAPALDITTPGLGANGGTTTQAVVTNLSKKRFGNPRELLKAIVDAAARRRQRATDRNEQSSRSHTWCVLEVLEPKYPGSDRYFPAGRLCFLDLAGSENIARSGVSGDGVREAGSINKSLLALNRVIMSLNRGEKHVPWRDGMVTRLLQDSLGGTTLTTFIACISPNPTVLGETFNTLNYATSVRKIENRPERLVEYVKSVSMAANSAAVGQLKAQVIERDALLAQYAERVGQLEAEVERLRRKLGEEREKNESLLSAARNTISQQSVALPDLLASELSRYMEGFHAMMLNIGERNAELAQSFAAALSNGINDGMMECQTVVAETEMNETRLEEDKEDPIAMLPALPPLPTPLDPSAASSRTPSPPRTPPREQQTTNPGLFSPSRGKPPTTAKLVSTPSSSRANKLPATPRGVYSAPPPGSVRKMAMMTPGRGVLKPSNTSEEQGTPASKKRKLEGVGRGDE